MTDWTPKIPGLIWSKEGMPRINEFDDEFDVLQVKDRLHPIVHPNSKSRRLNSGFGSVRTNPTNNPKESFAYLSLVSPKYWNTDFGIPVVVSKSVYEEFKSKSKKGAPWIEEAEGILIRDMDLPFNNIISSAIGDEVENNLKSELLKKPHIPRVYVLITSKLSIDLKENDTHPTTTAWTMFKSQRDYGLTYCHFNPFEKGSFEGVSDFLVEYVKRYGGTKIITDYDGLVPRLESTIRIDKDPAKHNQKEFKKVVQEIVERIK